MLGQEPESLVEQGLKQAKLTATSLPAAKADACVHIFQSWQCLPGRHAKSVSTRMTQSDPLPVAWQAPQLRSLQALMSHVLVIYATSTMHL